MYRRHATSLNREIVSTTHAELQQQVARILVPGGFPNPAREAELLIAAVLDRSPGQLELDRLLGRSLERDQVDGVLAVASRRARREPLQHLVGSAPFREVELAVGPGVFVPRPETELLVELVRTAPAARRHQARIADLGSGSGAIAIGVAMALPGAEVVALEASPFAWPWLQRNLRRHAPHVEARFGDWDAQLAHEHPASFDVLVSNPPYVPQREIPADPEVRLFDPETALYSGGDGLDEIRRIAVAAERLLRADGCLVVEHTEEQGAEIREIFAAQGLVDTATHPDLTGRDRFTSARQRG